MPALLRRRVLLGALLLSWAAAAFGAPNLEFEAPDRLRPLVRVLDGVAVDAMERSMDLVGLADPGPPIRVVLAPRGTTAEQRAPSWASAYAIGNAGMVVLLPDRIPSYPDRTLEEVLVHEVTHVLVARAAGRRPVPRWLDEGIALQAARPWNIDDQARLIRVSLGGRPPPLDTLDRAFRGGRSSAAGAYALSGAFVRYLMETAGEAAPARILHELGRGLAFEEAFRRATGYRFPDVEARFRRDLEPARLWLPLATDPTILWIGISLLAVVAWGRIRQRRAEREAAWLEEEERAREAEMRRLERSFPGPLSPLPPPGEEPEN